MKQMLKRGGLVVCTLLAAYGSSGAGQDRSMRGRMDEIKGELSAAIATPMEDRAKGLDKVESMIDQELNKGAGDMAQRGRLLELKYRVQKEGAKHKQARATFNQYARELKGWEEKGRAKATVIEAVKAHKLAGDPMECIALADEALASWGDDDAAAPAILLEKAASLAQLNGGKKDAVEVLEKLVARHPGSAARPEALRLMAHLQANGAKGGHKAALGTLAILEKQYAGTWWEQYAHMKPAVIFERRMGEPHKALERYQETLRKFPDHAYATFCRAQIERLQKIIEEQLVQDALQDLASRQPQECDQPTKMIVLAPPAGEQHAIAPPAGR